MIKVITEYDANGNMVGESYEDSGEVLISMSTTKMAMFSALKCLNPMTGMMMVWLIKHIMNLIVTPMMQMEICCQSL